MCCLTLWFFLFLAEGEEGEGGEGGEGAEGDEAAEGSSKEASPLSENADQEVIVEALKSICNILLHNQTGQVSPLCRLISTFTLIIVFWLVLINKIYLLMDGWQVVAADLQLIQGVAERLKQCRDPTWNHEVHTSVGCFN